MKRFFFILIFFFLNSFGVDRHFQGVLILNKDTVENPQYLAGFDSDGDTIRICTTDSLDVDSARVANTLNDGINKILSGAGTNTLIRNVTADQATRVHIEPSGPIASGTTSKLDFMFDSYEDSTPDYRILGIFLQTGDASENGRNAEANITLKAAHDFYGNFPLLLLGYQDNNTDQAVCAKMFYMDVDETVKPTPHKGKWLSGLAIDSGDFVQSNNFGVSPYTYGLYMATTTGTTGGSQPIHVAGSVSDGGVTWLFIKDYYVTASTGKLKAMLLFGEKSDYPVAGGHMYSTQFADGAAFHGNKDLAFFSSIDDSIAGKRKAIGHAIYDYYFNNSHYHKYTSEYAQHVGGATLLSTKTVSNDDGGTNITVNACSTDVLILDYASPTSISTIQTTVNQDLIVRVTTDSTVTLVNGNSLKLINGTQTLGVRTVLHFFARTTNAVIECGYTSYDVESVLRNEISEDVETDTLKVGPGSDFTDITLTDDTADTICVSTGGKSFCWEVEEQ